MYLFSYVSLLKFIIMRIEEAKKLHCSCVYCLLFPNGRRYIGKTKDLGSRMVLYESFGGSSLVSDAIIEFGLGVIDVLVLREVVCDDEVDLELCLSILEVRYIRDYRTTELEFGYNVSFGGECLGIPIEHLTTDSDVIRRYRSGEKVVLCYDLDGNYVREYESVARMSYDLGVDEGVIRGCLNSKKMFADRWYLRVKRYDYSPRHIELDLPKSKERIIYKDVVVERVKYKDIIVRREVEKVVERKVTKKCHILKYDMDGVFRGEYANFHDACKSFLCSSSGMTCGVYRKGYVLFKKEGDDYPQQIEPYHVLSKKVLGAYYRPAEELEDKSPEIKVKKESSGKVGRPKKESSDSKERVRLNVDGRYTNINNDFKIAQYTLDGELVTIHNSIRDASADTGINYANIWACVMGRTRKARGFYWEMYKE